MSGTKAGKGHRKLAELADARSLDELKAKSKIGAEPRRKKQYLFTEINLSGLREEKPSVESLNKLNEKLKSLEKANILTYFQLETDLSGDDCTTIVSPGWDKDEAGAYSTTAAILCEKPEDYKRAHTSWGEGCNEHYPHARPHARRDIYTLEVITLDSKIEQILGIATPFRDKPPKAEDFRRPLASDAVRAAMIQPTGPMHTAHRLGLNRRSAAAEKECMCTIM